MALVGTVKLFLFLVLLCLLHLLSSCQGRENWVKSQYPFIKRASSFYRDGHEREKGYDYIIVGGGTAGCPLAATLSQNFSVLLLERGGVPFTNANVSLLRNFHIGLADTSPTSASQAFASTDGVINARARVLGGGSAINAGFYTRASSRFIKRVGWDEQLVNESYSWVEKRIVHRPKLTDWQKTFTDSLLDVGISPFNGFTYDHLYGTKVGGTIFDRFGRRHTTAELLPSGNPDNLTVLVHATVQRLIFDTTHGKEPKAIGVVFKDETGNQHKVFLSSRRQSEVILSSGAIATPQMLLLSGIGPRDDLEKWNISMVLHNEFVGKDMADNPLNSIFVPSNRPVQQSLIQAVGITKRGVYIESSSGFGQSGESIHCHHGLLSAEIGQLSTIPPKQRTPEAIQNYIKSKRDLPHEAFKGGFILEKVANPFSKGHLRLINTNIDDNPAVTFNYFHHPYDLHRCVEGVRMLTKIADSEYFTNFTQCDKETLDKLLNISVKANINLIPKHTNDTKSLEQFCKDTVITIWHYHGGCLVDKVVSHDLKVLGVTRLRIIDGSTFSESPGTNPQATVMMMGRYMGLKILMDRLGKRAGT
ncbi:protein HOTHEAD-like [Cucurbita pepo subsp. pepo]|uniref:protein HOTHEAD-like n=1 Tax=Cucurbita pepo subsp. pepo TaxID=3664 RepID=UPI000C9D5EF5|nr:protein HOTHEAD-like [Cucurbita pepo subsp. pepo]